MTSFRHFFFFFFFFFFLFSFFQKVTSFVISYLLYAHQIPSRKGCTINGNNSLPNGAEPFSFGEVPLQMGLDVQEVREDDSPVNDYGNSTKSMKPPY